MVSSDASSPVRGDEVKSMNDAIIHRGPDDDGMELFGQVGMGFRRLSIIDLEHGHQPMKDTADRACITFNGEVYNFKELREELRAKGYQFATSSDTEVILNMYLEYGREFASRLRGMFAFAIFDFKKNKLLMGRDHFGIKPLYYAVEGSKLIYGSEIKSLRRIHRSNELESKALDSYFSYNYILDDLSIYKGIKRLRAGHTLEVKWDKGKFNFSDEEFFSPNFNESNTLSREELIEETRVRLRETVKTHLVADVPVGAFLSGGIDSNAVLSQMIDLYPDRVKTFTIGFSEAKYNEASLAKESAKKWETDHKELILEPSSAEIIDKIVDVYDEPYADSSAIPTYFLSELAAQYVKVVLSGDGGDEFFGGYTGFQRYKKIYDQRLLLTAGRPLFKAASSVMPMKMKGRRFLQNLSKPAALAYAYSMQVNNEEKKSLFKKDVYESLMDDQASAIKVDFLKNSQSASFMSSLFELDLRTFMKDDVLVKVDRASMAHSLEVRVPLIDKEFFAFASSISPEHKIVGDTGKYLLREAIKPLVPESIYSKPKTGFTIPLFKWFKSDLDGYMKDHISYLKTIGIFKDSYINQFLDGKDLGSMATRLWPLMMFSVWHQKNISNS